MFTQGNTRASKLSNEEVYEMRAEYTAGATQAYLSRKYGVTVGTVGRIVRGESHQRVPMPHKEEDHTAAQARLLALSERHGVEVVEQLTSEAQKVYEKEVKPEKDLERLKTGE